MVLIPKKQNSRSADIVLHIPAWAAKVYILLGVVLIPWAIYLGSSLPRHHLSTHWDVSWSGLDAGLVIFLVATGLFAYFRSIWVVIAASSTGTLLLVDAWFDVLSEKKASDFHQSLILAAFIEIPLALLSYYLAVHAIKHNTHPRLHKH